MKRLSSASPFPFTSTDPTAVLPADVTLTNGVSGVRAMLSKAGNQTITATDTVNRFETGVSSPVTVSAGATARFLVAAHGANRLGAAFAFKVIAQDAYGNGTPGYTGTVHFTSTDPKAILPVNTALVGGVVANAIAALKTAGNQTIAARDTVNRSVTGVSDTVTVGVVN